MSANVSPSTETIIPPVGLLLAIVDRAPRIRNDDGVIICERRTGLSIVALKNQTRRFGSTPPPPLLTVATTGTGPTAAVLLLSLRR